MAETDEGWDEGPATAIAGAAYSESIAKSEPDFESEVGTAVAGQDYVDNARKSGQVDPAMVAAALKASADAAAPVATPAHAKGQRAPTMAFGTPVLLRAPAQTPATALPTTRPATARTPGGGLPGVPREVPRQPSAPARAKTPAPEVVRREPSAPVRKTPAPDLRATSTDAEQTADAIPSVMRTRPSQQIRKPAPSPYVDQVYDSPSGATRQSRPSKPVQIDRVEERESPLAKQPRTSQRFETEHDPLPQPTPIDAEEDASASDLDAFDNAETMGQMRRSVPMAIPSAPSRPTPAPLASARASTPLPGMTPVDPLGQTVQAMQAMQAIPAPEPTPAPMPAMRPSHILSAQASAALPTSYPVMSPDARASYLAPLSSTSPMQGLQTGTGPALVEKPRKRGVWIGVALAVIAAGVVGFLLFSGGTDETTTAAAATAKVEPATPAVKTDDEKPEPEATPAAITAKDDETEEVAAKPEPDAEKPAIATTAKPEVATPETKPAAKPTAKPPVKRVAATKKAPVRKVVKKPVRKPVRRPAAKKPAAKCTGLDCL